MRRRSSDAAERYRTDLVGVSLVAAAAAVDAHAHYLPSPLNAIAGAGLVLVLPGYALMALAWVPGQLRPLLRLIGTLALSVAVSTLGGLALNYTGAGLTRNAWAIYLGALTVGAGIAAEARCPVAPALVPLRHLVRWSKLALLVPACLLVVAGLWLSDASARHQLSDAPGFTALSMLNLNQPDAGSVRLRIVVRSYAHDPQRLRLTVCANRKRLAASRFTLAPGARYEKVLVDSVRPRSTSFVAYLRRSGSPRIYRYVAITDASRSAAALRPGGRGPC